MPTLAAVVVNFTQFQLETHVEKALRRAWALAGGKPVTASHLLKGALLVARTDQSAAFLRLRSLLPLTSLQDVKTTEGPPADLAAMPLVNPLAESFSVAEGFLGDKKTVWGRDYVTLALLAKDDPSLGDIAREAGSDIDAVRRAWFDFVCASDQRRTPDAWQRWWRGAGVSSTTEEKPTPVTTPAYLLTWNPIRYPFPELDGHAQTVKAGGSTVIRWSTGNRRSMSRGERVFLLREGPDNRGLVGVGEVDGDVVEAPHWDENERKDGRTSLLVDVRWTALSREPFLDLSSLIQETGDASVWSSPSGGVALEPVVTQRLEEAWRRAWARHLHGLRDDRLPEIEPRQWIARFDADTGAQDDSLKVDRYVHAFARVMASRNLTPPLSIGLFGDWGSGKTFFMDRLYDKIKELAEGPDTEPPLYWHRICQMRFNAWHYTETNLWASLVSTIFSQLCRFLDPLETDEDQFNRLLNQLEVVQALRKEAEDKLADAKAQHAQAVAKVRQTENELKALPVPPPLSDTELRAILSQQVSAVLTTDRATLVRLLNSAATWSGRSDFKAAATRLSAGEDTIEAAQKLLAEAGMLSSQAGFWWRVLSGAKLHKTWSFWIVIALLATIPLVFAAAQSLGMQEGWVHVWTLLGEAVTVLGASVAWARSRLAGASAVFDRLATVRASIERSVEEARGKDRLKFEKERDEALAKEKDARARLEQYRREEEQAAEAERKAQEALRDSTSQARLGRFIRERTSSADYEKHLGLIAMIHRDFETLSSLMAAARTKAGDPALPRIDRIILYIDDLDRCHPPEKVVRALEAVHLLLFFPLFVVVVGVDSRWVSRSLFKHYQGMLADEAITPAPKQDQLSRAPAESQDFLEKIFQVPFWLRRMEPAAVQRLIHRLISPAEVAAAATPVATPPPADTALTEGPGVPAAAGSAQAGGTTAEAPARAAAKRVTAEAEIEDDMVGDVLTAPSESLTITEAEVQFMDQVAPLMPRTPRSVKRFVNIYRLYKAALSPPAFARFVGTSDRPGNFRAVQVLLALVTGVPRFAQRVFRELHGSEDVSAKWLSQLVDAFGDGDETWQTTLDALRDFATGKNDLELGELREVTALVSRYSVHHMVSSAPGEAGLG
jgi:hypothetical protein